MWSPKKLGKLRIWRPGPWVGAGGLRGAPGGGGVGEGVSPDHLGTSILADVWVRNPDHIHDRSKMVCIGSGLIPKMTEWPLPLQKKNLIYCPELVDHYR